MSPKHTACFSCRWLTFWLALSIVEGKDSSLFHGEENRDVNVGLTNADNVRTDNTEFPVGCGPRKLTKRSSSFDVPWLKGLESQVTNCRIFPVTTAAMPVTKPQTTTKDPGKANPSIESASTEHRPQLIYFLPYYPRQQQIFYNVLFPVNRGTNGYNGYNPSWYKKFPRENSSEEKRRKRDTLSIDQKRSKASLEE